MHLKRARTPFFTHTLTYLNLCFFHGGKKKYIDWLTNTSLSPAFKTLSRLLFCTQNIYISSLACTAQKTLFSSISVLIYAVCNGNRKRYRSQIHLFKFILSTDRELLTYYILNIVKIIPVTCYMSLQLFLLEKWTNRSTYFLKKLHMEMKKKKGFTDIMSIQKNYSILFEGHWVHLYRVTHNLSTITQ